MSTKVAFVTGSGKRRVGSYIVEALAARGYAIALHYNRSAEEARVWVERLRGQGVQAAAFQDDIADEGDIARAFDQVMATFGRLDVLVTAAAVWDPGPLEEGTAAEVRRQFDINTLGTFLCCQRAGMIMVKQPEGGTIVTIGDWATERPYFDYPAYFLSKGAITTMTRMLALELARRNPAVRVNCILPGPVMFQPDTPQADIRGAVAGTLVKRPGRPEHVAEAVVFLVENDFITGVSLPVDGGRTIAGYA